MYRLLCRPRKANKQNNRILNRWNTVKSAKLGRVATTTYVAPAYSHQTLNVTLTLTQSTTPTLSLLLNSPLLSRDEFTFCRVDRYQQATQVPETDNLAVNYTMLGLHTL